MSVFSTLLKIVQNEGVIGLYDGLTGEVLKGFLSHGVTMMVKESVHRLIIQAYYLVLKALQRYPSPTDLTRRVADVARNTAADLSEKSQEMATHLRDGGLKAAEDGQRGLEATRRAGYEAGKTAVDASNRALDSIEAEAAATVDYATEKGGAALESMREQGGAVTGYVQTKAATVVGKTQNQAREAVQQGSTHLQNFTSQTKQQMKKGSDTAGRAFSNRTATVMQDGIRSMTEAVGQQTAQVTEGASKEWEENVKPGVDSVREYVGRQTEGAGRAIRPSTTTTAKGDESPKKY